METELYQKLEQLAYERTVPFCYSCYQDAKSGTCEKCGSDDLMRHLPGVGCEYGVDWVIKEILSEELSPVDLDDAFSESVRQCYPEETTVGWMSFDTVSLLKGNDPVGWRCAVSDYESNEVSEGTIVSFDSGSTYYSVYDVERL